MDELSGLTADELHRRVTVALRHRRRDIVSARDMTRWLVREQLAEMRGRRLVPTRRALEVGGALEELRPGHGRE